MSSDQKISDHIEVRVPIAISSRVGVLSEAKVSSSVTDPISKEAMTSTWTIPTPRDPRMRYSKSEKKHARASAIFYSECSIHGIPIVEANAAALDAQLRYEKWWKLPPKVRKGRKRSHSDPELQKSQLVEIQSVDGSDGLSELISESEVPVLIRENELAVQAILKEKDDAKENIILYLKSNGGSIPADDSGTFHQCLRILNGFHHDEGSDVRWKHEKKHDGLNGSWLTLTKPTFSDCQGINAKDEYLYSLGRLSFDFFRPTQLLCSIQGIYSRIVPMEDIDKERRPKAMPFALQRISSHHRLPIRAYDIVVEFTVEDADKKKVKGILTNCGYCTPDPSTPNRLTIWFSGGILEAKEESDLDYWKELFADSNLPNRDLGGFARVLAAKILLGAQMPDGVNGEGRMSYSLNRPIGGHGSVYIDTLYSDETLRIVKGHMGSIFVFIRSNSPGEQ